MQVHAVVFVHKLVFDGLMRAVNICHVFLVRMLIKGQARMPRTCHHGHAWNLISDQRVDMLGLRLVLQGLREVTQRLPHDLTDAWCVSYLQDGVFLQVLEVVETNLKFRNFPVMLNVDYIGGL